MLEIDYTSRFERDEAGSSACKSGKVSRNPRIARHNIELPVCVRHRIDVPVLPDF